MTVCLKDHIPTLSSITSIRTALRDKPFSPKTHASIAAIARLHMDSCFIHKLHFLFRRSKDEG